MKAQAVVFEKPGQLALRDLPLTEAGDEDVIVDIEWSGISTGTERLLWTGRMPEFPGMGYPLVPGYESVGVVRSAGKHSGGTVGQRVFVPGAKCFGDVRGLFGGAASTVVLPASRTLALDMGQDDSDASGEQGVLLALAATAHHVSSAAGGEQPELIIGHGVLGRMLARIAVAAGGTPTVWETNPSRREGATGYAVVDPSTDSRRDYRSICDVSGDASLLDTLIGRLKPGGEICLAGFYDKPLTFEFAPAFMREARIRVAAQWQPHDLAAVRELLRSQRLSLAGLITHRVGAQRADDIDSAYRTAFGDPACLKMVLDWRSRT